MWCTYYVNTYIHIYNAYIYILLFGSCMFDLYIVYGAYKRIRQWSVTDIGGWPLVNESSRNIIKVHWSYIFQRRGMRLRFERLFGFYFTTIHLREVSHHYQSLARRILSYVSSTYVYTGITIKNMFFNCRQVRWLPGLHPGAGQRPGPIYWLCGQQQTVTKFIQDYLIRLSSLAYLGRPANNVGYCIKSLTPNRQSRLSFG